MYGNHKFAILNQNATNIKAFALCIIKDYNATGKINSKFFYVAEQVMLCLMGTYKAGVRRQNSTSAGESSKLTT